LASMRDIFTVSLVDTLQNFAVVFLNVVKVFIIFN